VREQRLRVEQALRNTPDPREPADAGRNAAEAARLAAEQSRLQAREDQLRRELTALQPKR
jgi:ABC-type phosphate transport system auxiliary subunit